MTKLSNTEHNGLCDHDILILLGMWDKLRVFFGWFFLVPESVVFLLQMYDIIRFLTI